MNKIKSKAVFDFLIGVFLISIFSSFAFAQLSDDVIYNSQFLDMEVSVVSSLKLKPTSSAGFAEYINADLLLSPRETDYQKVFSMKTIAGAPKYQKIGGTAEVDKLDYKDKLRFTWENPSTEELPFGVTGTLRVENRYAPIAAKIDFPLNIDLLPEQVLKYILPTKNIDSTDEAISRLASNIVQGEDDYYKAVFKTAKWVKTNINYSLDTLTAEAVQKSSWVLEHREGVCDELTALFIALLRSVGVPARYLSGVAYTNWQNMNDWGPHAWAEVYFPITKDIGVWVPYDVTYGQFGYVDPTHLILRINDDSDSTSTKYEWRGKNVELDTKKIDVKAKFLDNSGKVIDNIAIDVEPVKKEVGFGSYNLIKATVRNLLPVYTATELYLAKTSDIMLIEDYGEQTLQLVLTPNEEKTLYWIVKVSDELKRDFIYTLPAHVYSVTNVTARSTYTSTARDPVYSLDDIKSLIDGNADGKTGTANPGDTGADGDVSGRYDLAIKCAPAKTEYYVDEELSVECKLRNTGNFILDNVDVCLKNDCKQQNLAIGQEKDVSFVLKLSEEKPGKKDMIVKAKHEKIARAASAEFELISRPDVKIKDVTYPATIEYGKIFVLNFTLEPSSDSKNTTLVLKQEDSFFSRNWDIGILDSPKRFSITLHSGSFTLKPNKFKIILTYSDNLGKEYTSLEEFTINLENVTFGQKVLIWLNYIGQGLAKMFGG